MIITIITDNINSWFIPFGEILQKELQKKGHIVYYVTDKSEIKKGEVCFILSCSKIIEEEYLKLNKHNIVVHASDLPAGKGFSPLQWQILEGKNEIILTLFEAVKEVDAGPFYIKRKLLIESTDLLYESRKKMGNLIVNMCIEYIEQGENIKPIKQIGEESFYRKRKREDDEIDINKTIKEQFNHFRIADNEKFSLYFEYLGEKYILKIYKESADD